MLKLVTPQRPRLGRTRAAALLAAASIGAVAVAVAGAQVGEDGVIQACVKGNGSLRIAAADAACAAGETPLQWNQQGPQGPRGETGPQGPPGPPATVQREFSTSVPADEESPKEATAVCEEEQVLVGGGFQVLGGTNQESTAPAQITVQSSRPEAGQSWFVRAVDAVGTNAPWALRAVALCAERD